MCNSLAADDYCCYCDCNFILGSLVVAVHRLYDNDAEDIHAWYTRGIGLSSRLELPVFLAWEPEPGWEEDRLWRKGWTWALAMGLGWLPALGLLTLPLWS